MNNQNITVNMENLSQEERSTLLSLIEKANKPKNKVWKPEKDETYYYLYSYGKIEEDTWDNANEDRIRYAIGNCFKTKEEAEFALERQKVITELKRFALEHNDKEIDWNNIEQRKCFLSYQHDKNIIFIFALERQKVITELKRFALEHNDKEIDWNNIEQRKCFLSYQHDKNIIFIDFYYSVQIYNIYFTSEEIAQAAIKEIGEERLRKYYFEVKE